MSGSLVPPFVPDLTTLSVPAPLAAVMVGRSAGWLSDCRRQLEALPEVGVLAACGSLAELSPILAGRRPSLAILDARLLAESPAAHLLPLLVAKPVVVWVAGPNAADNALLGALYPVLTRPLDPRQLRRLLGREPVDIAGQQVVLAQAGRQQRVPMAAIVAIRSNGDYTTVWVEGHRPYLIHKPISAWERELRCAGFWHLDRFHLVNPSRITGLSQDQATGRDLLLLTGGPSLSLSRVGSRKVRAWLKAACRPLGLAG